MVICQILPLSFICGQDLLSDSLLNQERDYFYRKYRSVRDTMTMNTWLNLKRVTDNLEQVVKRDQQVIDARNARISADSSTIANLNDIARQFSHLNIRHNELKAKVKEDSAIMLYLKVAAGSLLFLLLIFLFLLFSIYRSSRKYSSQNDEYEAMLEEKQHLLDALDVELRKLKTREMEFRDELEQGMQANQDRLLAIQQKCSDLEKQNNQLREAASSEGRIYVPVSGDGISKPDIPDDVEELKQLVRSLIDERNSLMNLAGKLRTQSDAENKKSQAIIEKINLLARELGTQGGEVI